MMLSERVQQLEDYVAELKATFGLVEDPRWLALGLTVMEGRIMAALMKNDVLSKEALMFALYDGGIDAYDRSTKILDVYVCKINRKLAPHGIRIENVWSRGRRLSAESKQKLKEL
jgi:DNA-binding response OmpR family regulator